MTEDEKDKELESAFAAARDPCPPDRGYACPWLVAEASKALRSHSPTQVTTAALADVVAAALEEIDARLKTLEAKSHDEP
jgi:hypothetical protein